MSSSREFLGHPRGLFILFFTEMWERFSYYGMRALLVLYMTQHLLIEVREKGQYLWGYQTLNSVLTSAFGEMSIQAFSSQIYGLYTGLVYFTPFFGGIIADRYLGHRRSIYLGGFLMAIGHFLMAIESLFIPALVFLIIGNGFFKPNISTQVGTLYPEGDQRRDRAFTIFYMGINLGALFSPLVCGTLGQKYGWHYGFAAAGVGMLIGILVYHFGKGELPVEHAPIGKIGKATQYEALTTEDYKKVAALFFLCVVNICFWAVYEQQGNTLQLWAENNTDWNFFGLLIPSTWFQSFNPLFILVLAPILDWLWSKQSKKNSEPNSVSKMAIGCFLASIAYLVMYEAAEIVGSDKGSPLWLVGTVILFTLGELYLSPIGLSLVTKLAPLKIISMMMGLWFLSSFAGNYLAGYVGSYYQSMGGQHFFLLLAGLAFAASVIFFFARWPLKRLIP